MFSIEKDISATDEVISALLGELLTADWDIAQELSASTYVRIDNLNYVKLPGRRRFDSRSGSEA